MTHLKKIVDGSILWKSLIKEYVFVIVLSLLTCLFGCGDNLDIPNQPLQGVINGEPWNSESANAFRVTTDGQYRARFLSDSEPVSDPCNLPVPGRAHVKALFRPSIGDFTVAPFALADNQVQVAFELSPSTSLNAVFGNMAIFDIQSNIVTGYLQAELDDENKVEGVFRVIICD